MPVRISKNVSLTPELEAFVDERVASGRYQTASEVIRAALRLLHAQELREERKGSAAASGTRGKADAR